MEIDELRIIWKQYDKKISDNTRLNKEILKRMLVSKTEKRLNWIKIKAGFNVFSPIFIVLVIMLVDIKFILTINFYIGLSLYLAVSVVAYIWNIRYFLLIRKIDFSEAILSIKKGIAELEKYKIKTTRIKYIIAPFAVVGIFFMIYQKPIFNTESTVFFGLVLVVFIVSIYYTFKYSISEQFRKLDEEIAEIVELEKE